MAKARSPSYPSISLREAVDKVGMIYASDYQNGISRELVAQHIGYRGINGKSLGNIASIVKYGLLESRGSEVAVSDLAVRIIAHQPGSGERIEALREAASKPELFAELDSKFGDGKASDHALRGYLLTRKFIPIAADLAIRSYRETKLFVEEESGGYNNPPGATLQHTGHQVPSPSTAARNNPPLPPFPPPVVEGVDNVINVGISDGRIDVSATLKDLESVDKLIRVLQANRVLLPTIRERIGLPPEKVPPAAPRAPVFYGGGDSASGADEPEPWEHIDDDKGRP